MQQARLEPEPALAQELPVLPVADTNERWGRIAASTLCTTQRSISVSNIRQCADSVRLPSASSVIDQRSTPAPRCRRGTR